MPVHSANPYGRQARCLSYFIAVATVATVRAATIDSADILAKSIFNPVITVPLIDAPPTIDGEVKDDEWGRASLVPDLIADAGENAVGGGLVFEERPRYWIQYDKDAIYVAARFDVPEWSAAPQVYGTAHDVGGREDAVDIFFDPDGEWTRDEEWHFGGNAAGNTYDRDLKNLTRLWRWNPKWDYKARIFPGGWEAEMRIPFAEFEGRKTPVPGEKWRCNLYSVRQVPNFGVSSWAYVQTWRTPNMHVHNGWLIFSGQPLAARFDQGANVAGSHGILVRIVGQKPAEPIQTQFQLYRREGLPKPEEPGQMTTLSTMVDNITVGGTDAYGLTYEKAIELGMSPMKKVEGGIEQTTENGLPSVKIRPTELGEYMLEYRMTKGDAILTAGLLPFRVKPPVDLQVKPRILLQSKVEFETSLTGMEDPGKAKQLKLTVAPAGIEHTTKIEGPRVIVDVPADKLPPGKYTAHVDVLDASGTKIGSSTKEFPVAPLPDWWRDRRGFAPEVPKPWTGVEWKNGRVEVWGRQYKFDGLPVPSAITATPDNLSDAEPPAKPVELLAAPMELNATAGGQPVTWKSERFEVVQQKPEGVVIESVNTGGGLVMTGKTTIEFDGMIRVDLEVTGAFESLDLAIPFRPEAAEFLSNYRKAPGPGKIPTRYIGRVPAERWTFPIFHTQWVGNNKVGLEWFCDSMKGWRLTGKKADEATEVVRADGRVVEIFHMVDKAVTPDKPVAITFGLIATPTKPAPRGWEIYRTDELISFPPVIGKMLDPRGGEKTATQADVDEWKRRAAFGGAKLNTAFWPNWSGVWYFSYPVDHDPEVFKEVKWRFDIAHELGMKVGPYSI